MHQSMHTGTSEVSWIAISRRNLIETIRAVANEAIAAKSGVGVDAVCVLRAIMSSHSTLVAAEERVHSRYTVRNEHRLQQSGVFPWIEDQMVRTT